MKTAYKLKLDPERLPEIEIRLDAALDPWTTAAAEAVVNRRGFMNCIAKAAPAIGHDSVIRSFGFYIGRDYAAARDEAAAILQGGPNAFLELLIAVCWEAEGDREKAAQAAIDALESLAGVSHTRVSESARLTAGLQIFAEANLPAFENETALMISRSLNRLGVFQRHENEVGAVLSALLKALNSHAEPTTALASAMCVFLGLDNAEAPRWQDRVFRDFFMPVFVWVLQLDNLRAVINLEDKLYRWYVKPRENADHFRRVYRQLAPLIAEKGRAFAKRLPAIHPSVRKPRYRVAFVSLSLVDLAHALTMLDIVDCINARADRRVDCEIVGLGPLGPEMQARQQRYGIEIHRVFPDKSGGIDVLDGLMRIRSLLAAQNFDAIVWVSLAPQCALAMSMRLAPVQIFFSMKYHSFSVPEIDDYLTGGPAGQRFNVIEGRQWRVATSRYADLFDASVTEKAAAIRAELGLEKVVLGCIGREEKINSPEFLDAVVEILLRYPQTVFLWTGKVQLPAIQDRFDSAGVAARCRYIGWVDTRLYAQVLDVFLDSFPFPCAVTALQAMSAGKPGVFFRSAEALETGVPVFIHPVLSGQVDNPGLRSAFRDILEMDQNPPCFTMAETGDAYVAMASRLVADAALRRRVGEAQKAFVERFLVDKEECGRTYEQHLFEAIDSRATAT